MNLDTIINQIRQHAPVFSGRVAGAARFELLPETANLVVPAAYVVPLDDQPHGRMALNSVRQGVDDNFAVIVAISNVPDERGQAAAATAVHSIRAALWSALLGFQPTLDYRGIDYQGGTLITLDRSRLWYQYEFSAYFEITDADGWQATELAALPHFDGANINVDSIDPEADPNLQYPGPDGRIEHTATVPPTGNLP